MSFVLISASATSISGRASLNLDTRGATVIYFFAYANGNADGTPDDGQDSMGNVWNSPGNPFSTCYGSTGSGRCFNPITAAVHNFRAVGPAGSYGGIPFTVQLIVVALTPTVASYAYLNNRAASEQSSPASAGSFITPYNNYAMIASCMCGCGFSNLSVDSGFTIIQQLDNLAVAVGIQAVAGPVNVLWSGFSVVLPPDPNPIPAAGLIIEGFGIHIEQPPVLSNTRIYEA